MQDQYDVVFDDDGSGEIAGVVAIRAETPPEKRTVHVDLYHCKYSLAPTVGSRIDDLYVVCGQAQKSVSWAYSEDKQVDLFSHLLRREPKQREGKEGTRFEKGTKQALLNLRDIGSEAEDFYCVTGVIEIGRFAAAVATSGRDRELPERNASAAVFCDRECLRENGLCTNGLFSAYWG